jgi:two-component system, cell cycle response regulator
MSLFKKERLSADGTGPARAPARHAVMVVDDEDGNLRVMSWMLSEHYRVLEAHDGREALDLLQSLSPSELPSVIISDQRMPRMCGVELFEQVRSLYPSTIRIILTGLVDANAIIDSVNRAGVFRFVVKPCDRGSLLATIASAIEAFERVNSSPPARVEAGDEAGAGERWRDPLTGLGTRQAVSLAAKQNAAAVLRLDIDGFGDYLRRAGEAAGDRLLVAVATILRQHCGADAQAVRWASDEFLVCFADPDAGAAARSLATRLRRAVAALSADADLAITCSIGLCCPSGDPGQAVDDATSIDIAGAALAMARRGGGDRVVCLTVNACPATLAGLGDEPLKLVDGGQLLLQCDPA